MIIKTGIDKAEDIKISNMNAVLRHKALIYIKMICVKNSAEIKKWNKYFIDNYNMNIIQACTEVIENSSISILDNKYAVNINPTYEYIYKLMSSGNLSIGKTELLKNAFRYALSNL